MIFETLGKAQKVNKIGKKSSKTKWDLKTKLPLEENDFNNLTKIQNKKTI